MDEKKRAPKPGEPDPNAPRQRDAHASPLHRGADPGKAADTYPLSGGPSISGQRGHARTAQRGGPSGLVDRENEDSVQEARDARRVGHESSPNDTGA